MKRYKLARIVDDKFYSANTIDGNRREYQLGQVTEIPGRVGVACYKRIENADRLNHLRETMNSFNDGCPIAILEVRSIGRAIRPIDVRYKKGQVYEGGVNYNAIRVLKVYRRITRVEY